MSLPVSDPIDPRVDPQRLPALSRQQMEDVDRLVMEVYHLELIQMMENAGRLLAELARERIMGGDVKGAHVAVLAGRGGDGGGALVAARHLINWGASVEVVLARNPSVFEGVPAHQLDILRAMGVALYSEGLPAYLSHRQLVIDGLIGYNLHGAPIGRSAELIRWANRQAAPVLSLDTPSGLDITSGTPFDPTVKAFATMTLALPKRGLLEPEAAPFVGELYLADISIPLSVYARLGISVPDDLFSRQSIVRIN